jgi:hypothetical protein
MTATADPITELRSLLGEEQFRRFMVILRDLPAGEQLRFWQERALERLAGAKGIDLPRSPAELRAVLADAIVPRQQYAEPEVPSWLIIDELSGSSPVQGEGRCFGWRWYFRARGGEWSIGAAQGSVDPVDVFSNSDSTFYHEEAYGDGPYAAGHMPLEEARFFIVRELSGLAARMGWI